MKVKVYCERCASKVNYVIIDNVEYEVNFENEIIKYVGKKAICESCQHEVFVEEIEAYNQQMFEEAYKKQLKIISTIEIDEILKKYNIGKRPLSLILGLGEVTISRYYNGYIPSNKISSLLKEINLNPEKFYSFLMMNKEKITTNAYIKAKNKVEELLNIKDGSAKFEDMTIKNVAKYIINKIEVTPMALQKLLYYVQIFAMGLNNTVPFSSKCSAWTYGPVFGKIYYEYKDYKSNTIESNELEETTIDDELKEVVDNVIKFFGCYSALVLKAFTHSEYPWINCKEQNKDIIEKSTMKNFAKKIISQYEINSIDEIYKYSKAKYEEYFNSLFNN